MVNEEIDINVCRLLSNPRCAHCKSKGYLVVQLGPTVRNKAGEMVHGPIIGKGKDAVVSEYVKYCSCVESKLQKKI